MHENKSVKKNVLYQRNSFIDFVKGVLIFLVVLGHCIQYGSGKYYFTRQSYFENILFKIIYSFHMPLFSLISGFLFFYSCQSHSEKALLFDCELPI